MEKKKIKYSFLLLTSIFIFHQIVIFTLWNGLGKRFPFSTGTDIFYLKDQKTFMYIWWAEKGVWVEERRRLGFGLRLAPTINQSLLLVYLY